METVEAFSVVRVAQKSNGVQRSFLENSLRRDAYRWMNALVPIAKQENCNLIPQLAPRDFEVSHDEIDSGALFYFTDALDSPRSVIDVQELLFARAAHIAFILSYERVRGHPDWLAHATELPLKAERDGMLLRVTQPMLKPPHIAIYELPLCTNVHLRRIVIQIKESLNVTPPPAHPTSASS